MFVSEPFNSCKQPMRMTGVGIGAFASREILIGNMGFGRMGCHIPHRSFFWCFWMRKDGMTIVWIAASCVCSSLPSIPLVHGLLSALAPKGGRACADRRVDGSRINRRANEIFFGGGGKPALSRIAWWGWKLVCWLMEAMCWRFVGCLGINAYFCMIENQ